MLLCLAAHITNFRTASHPGSLVWDTHTKPNLTKRSTNMSITAQNVRYTDAHTIIAVWEVEHGALAKKDHSQLYGYLQLLGRTQPYRHNSVGTPSNVSQNIDIHYRSPLGDKPCACKVYNPAYVISYIRECIPLNGSYHPASPMYLRTIYRRLGHSLLNVVAAFEVPKDLQNRDFQEGKWINATLNTAKYMVVKRTLPATIDRAERSVAKAMEMLHYITSLEGHRSLSKLMYHCSDNQEFVITPHALRQCRINWSCALIDVLAALK